MVAEISAGVGDSRAGGTGGLGAGSGSCGGDSMTGESLWQDVVGQQLWRGAAVDCTRIIEEKSTSGWGSSNMTRSILALTWFGCRRTWEWV